ncbi:MAG: nif-specific transcriptional activator NifA [candidate division NC10 bacterium RIFCSPLOWO2_12_FULL_66_18]|nr:MAG: nif-specific transcriptional activator NifA [candidate division NC10 bacterium RIFCSPLOWO2_02_FULL_66_22]OGB98828.1 MAG: nif-specific transcriptional activator NifA [candidate division NC10 bacterium RIFCSPLOWO2_12_FULL_66_18]
MSHIGERQQSNRRVLELTTLYEISKILGSSLDLEQSLTGTLRILNSFMGMRKGTILLYDATTGELSIRLALGMTPAEMARGKYQMGEGILGKVMQHGLPMVIPDIGQEPLFLDRTRSRGDLGAQPIAFIAVPIKVGGETLGVLSVDRLFAEETSFEEDVRVLTIVASLIGQTVNLQQHVMREREGLLEQTRSLQQALRARYRLDNIVGRSKRMREIYEAVEQVSQTRTTVLIRGESGTGKELIARAIHFNSPRASGPFVKLNCAALPQSLLESELFGHEKGAFTGATAAKKGRFELADRGSLFLDEIGDIPMPVQVKLLRVLQERCFERVGGTKTIAVDVRIIAATHQDLEAAIPRGEFREDLYYRLNVVPLLLPSLRERREDIPLLIEHFLAKWNRENNRRVRITGRALQAMLNYDWPGNVRELENCIERMVVMSRRRLVLPEDLPLSLEAAQEEPEEARAKPVAGRRNDPGGRSPAVGLSSLRDLEQQQIIRALARADGIQARAAALLGITPRQLGYRLRRHQIVRSFQLPEPPRAREA